MPTPSQTPEPPLDPRVATNRRLQGEEGSAEQFVIGEAQPINKEVGSIDFGQQATREKQKEGWERLKFWKKERENVGVPAGAIAREALGGAGTLQNRENFRKLDRMTQQMAQLRAEIPELTQEQLDRMSDDEKEAIRQKRNRYLELHDAHRAISEFQVAASSFADMERVQKLLENPNATPEEKAELYQMQAAYLASTHWGISKYQSRYEINTETFTAARVDVATGKSIEQTDWYKNVSHKVALEYGMREDSLIVQQAVQRIFRREQSTSTSMNSALVEVENAMLGAARPELRAKLNNREIAMQQTTLRALRNNHFIFRVLSNEAGPQAAMDEMEKYLAGQRRRMIDEARGSINKEASRLAPEKQSPTLKGLIKAVDANADEYHVLNEVLDPALKNATRKQERAEQEFQDAHREADALRQKRAEVTDEIAGLREDREKGVPVRDFDLLDKTIREDSQKLVTQSEFNRWDKFFDGRDGQGFKNLRDTLRTLSTSDTVTRESLAEAGITSTSIGQLVESLDSQIIPEIQNYSEDLQQLKADKSTLEEHLAKLEQDSTVLESDRRLFELEGKLIDNLTAIENDLKEALEQQKMLANALEELSGGIRDNNEQDIRNAAVTILSTSSNLQAIERRTKDSINPGGEGNLYQNGHYRRIHDARNELASYNDSDEVKSERNERKRKYVYALRHGSQDITNLRRELTTLNRELSGAEREESQKRSALESVRRESAQEAARAVSRDILGTHIGNDNPFVQQLERELMADFNNPRTADKKTSWYKILAFLDRAFQTEIATPYTAPPQPAARRARRTFDRSQDVDNDDWDNPRPRPAGGQTRGGGQRTGGRGGRPPRPGNTN